MKLSIITVNLNNVDGLKKTAESIISQTFQDFEWIVIDGGSTDGSKELIEQYSEHIAYWCSEKDSGIYNAMNKGIRHAKGDYLNFMNSGDLLYGEDTLESVFANASYENVDVLYGNEVLIDGEGKVVKEIKLSDDLSFYYLVYCSIRHQASFISRQLLIDTGYSEEYKIVSDLVFFINMALQGRAFKHIDINISRFQTGGVTDRETTLWKTEMMRVQREVIPASIRYDFSYGQYSLFRGLKDKYKLFGKFITAQLLFMRFIDKTLYLVRRKFVR